jgi:hypothetical protein
MSGTGSIASVEPLWYFAYGSNMSVRRMTARIPSAEAVGIACLPQHRLAFHKIGRDGSGKCDITPCGSAAVHGVIYRMAGRHKPLLDACEDLGRGYLDKRLTVSASDGSSVQVFTYVALRRDASLRPFDWYLRHLIEGAEEHCLPRPYRDRLAATESIDDPDRGRRARELSIYAFGST